MKPAQLLTTNPGVLAINEKLLKPALDSPFPFKGQLLPGSDPSLFEDCAEASSCLYRKKGLIISHDTITMAARKLHFTEARKTISDVEELLLVIVNNMKIANTLRTISTFLDI